jgi:hypothetical protein
MWPIDPFQRHQKEEARFDYFYKSNSVFIILLNVIKFECGLEMGLIIFVCKPVMELEFKPRLKLLKRSAMREGVLLCLGKVEIASPTFIHRRLTI